MASMIGKNLGHYLVLRELGSGAMGQVYLAQDCKLQRSVALKLLPPEVAADPGRRRRFAAESRALAALNHPNVVTIHAVEEADGQLFLVMEWIEGRSLADLLAHESLPSQRCLELALPIVEGIAQAHQAGIVHRDLKPANVMVRADGTVKVVDFGIAKMDLETLIEGTAGLQAVAARRADNLVGIDPLTTSGKVLGTLPYMSPEQLRGLPVDARSDIYSLGVIFYQMATGRLPFPVGPLPVFTTAVFRASPPPFGGRGSPQRDGFEVVVMRCLAKTPDARYSSAAELRQALARLGARTAVGSPAPSPASSSQGSLRWSTGAADTAISVAMLPLRNLSSDPEQDYFSDGTTEAVIASLAKVGGLRVISRNSIMSYKGSDRSLPEIAGELGVSHVLEGSVMRSGHQIMIVIQLVEPRADRTIWGETYRGSMKKIFQFQEDVARAVARETKGELTSADRSRLARVQEVETAVYEIYLKARHLLNQRTTDSVSQALLLLDQALVERPDYALAWAAKAECYGYRASFGLAVANPRETIPKLQEAARRAIELDDSLSEAHVALALAAMQTWQWEEADREFVRALERNPSNAYAHMRYTSLLTAMGRLQEALDTIQKARKLDPLSSAITLTVATIYFFAGRFVESLSWARRAQEAGDFWGNQLLVGECHTHQGSFAEAEVHLRRALEQNPRNLFVLGALGRNLARRGEPEAAREILSELERRGAVEYLAPTLPAKLLFALGEHERGFGWLRRAFRERDQSLSFLKVDPDYAAVRSDSKFLRLIDRIGLARQK